MDIEGERRWLWPNGDVLDDARTDPDCRPVGACVWGLGSMQRCPSGLGVDPGVVRDGHSNSPKEGSGPALCGSMYETRASVAIGGERAFE